MPTRGIAARFVRTAWRCLKVMFGAFAGIGPAPPPRPDPYREVAELHVDDAAERAQR